MDKHRVKAWQWMAENPRAYQLFSNFASRIAATGKRFGAKLVSERVRWEWYFSKGGQTCKWNNNYTKYVAERWAEENPRYAHLLEFRNKGA